MPWHSNVAVRQVYARNVTGDARAFFPDPAIGGWRNITGPPDTVTNILIVLSDAATNNRRCNVFIGFGGTILSAQAPS
jgi:hypothetical protein